MIHALAVAIAVLIMGLAGCELGSTIRATTNVVAFPNAIQVRGVAWHPDNSKVVVAAEFFDGDHRVSRLVSADLSGELHFLTGNHVDGMPVWSPDGEAIAFIRQGNDWWRAVQGGGPLPPNNVGVVSASGGHVEVLTQSQAERNYFLPVWSADGEYVAAAVGDKGKIWVGRVRRKPFKKPETVMTSMLPGMVLFRALNWSLDGGFLVALVSESVPPD